MIKKQRRENHLQETEQDAITEAKAGDVGQTDWEEIQDPETGEIIGRRSRDGKQEWRIDRKGYPEYHEPPHVNWKNWKKGKQEGGYGHVYYSLSV